MLISHKGAQSPQSVTALTMIPRNSLEPAGRESYLNSVEQSSFIDDSEGGAYVVELRWFMA